jgi:DNA-binding LacI/PurR family transcriptional regulator
MLFDAAPDVTAVLAMSDVLALGAIAEAGRRGLSVPRDLSVIGYDDVPEAARSEPPLTTVAQPTIRKGRLAAHMIFDRGPPRKEFLPIELVVRGSTGPVRVPR